jgi:hypothetical protein
MNPPTRFVLMLTCVYISRNPTRHQPSSAIMTRKSRYSLPSPTWRPMSYEREDLQPGERIAVRLTRPPIVHSTAPRPTLNHIHNRYVTTPHNEVLLPTWRRSPSEAPESKSSAGPSLAHDRETKTCAAPKLSPSCRYWLTTPSTRVKGPTKSFCLC